LADFRDSRSDRSGDLPIGPHPRQPGLPRRGLLWQRSRLSATVLPPSEPETAAVAAEQQVLAELRKLRSEINGVDGSVVATSDGLLVAEDLPGLEPTKVSAVIATAIGLARQAVQLTGRGQLTEAIVRGSAGNLAVFAIGHGAVLAVLGRKDLNIGMLHFQTRAAVGRIEEAAPEFRRFAAAHTMP
jgi:predicted regulator of Ras-like GTPase activity (Roadblock/LC7/MglB family)